MGDSGNLGRFCLSSFPEGCSFQNHHHHHHLVQNCLRTGRQETAFDPIQNQGKGACLNSLQSRAPQSWPVNSQKMGRLEEETRLESRKKIWDLWERRKTLSLYIELGTILLCARTRRTIADYRLEKHSQKGFPIGPITCGGRGFILGMAEAVRQK